MTVSGAASASPLGEAVALLFGNAVSLLGDPAGSLLGAIVLLVKMNNAIVIYYVVRRRGIKNKLSYSVILLRRTEYTWVEPNMYDVGSDF